MKKILYIAVLFPLMVFSQTPTATENYVRSKTYKIATTTSIASPTPAQATQSITYFDGLGRPIQQIANAQSNTSKDIITHIEYDAYGRQVREYLPFASAQNTMGYSDGTTLKQDQQAQYQTWYGDNNPFSEKLLEASPLNRVLEQAAPGNDWSLTNSVKHTVRFDYQSNTATGSFVAKLFKANATWDTGKGLYEITMTANGTTNYPANQLYVTTTKDENWINGDGNNNTTQEFKDKEGRVVLKRTFDNGIAHDTYYVYDNFGNLTYVIPPKADGSIDNNVLNNLCYQYKYDHRNRLVEKKLPGKDWEFMVYDKLDRVVATGPALSPFTDVTTTGWMITKYDAFNRPVYTGWENTTATRIAKQTTQNGLTTLSESKTTSGTIDGISVNYSNTVVPTTFKLLTVNYYDDYAFPNAPTSFGTVEGQTVFYNTTNKPKGLATGSWVRVLSTSSTIIAESSYTLYDFKARPLRTYTTNYLGGFTQTDSQLETITGRTNYTITTHKRIAASTVITVREDFTYTAQDRLLTHTHKINSNPTQLLAENTYDELGQLISKKVGNTSAQSLQKVDYNYNIRGWLLNINNTSNLTEGTNPQDLFAFKINYNSAITNNEGNTIVPLYNGNIAETTWLTNTDNFLRRYGYSYDNLNRLKKAVYQRPNTAVPVTNSYNESLTYDKNGNIMSLRRHGDLDNAIDQIEIDNLAYTYNGNSSNQLMKVFDGSRHPAGFDDDSVDGLTDPVNDYAYDANGNMISVQNKGITSISYNHLNLPIKIIFNHNTNTRIEYLYTANGQKMQKKVYTSSTEMTTTDYLGGFQYSQINAGTVVLDFFPHAEGYVNNTVVSGNNVYSYVFNYTDHLGNIRLRYTIHTNGTLRILEQNHYYPFGVKHEKYNTDQFAFIPDPNGGYNSGVTTGRQVIGRIVYQYKYNGKELQDELGLNMYDYGARNYDPAIGRWMNIDPLAEQYRRWSPYNYCVNNPIIFVDPDGMGVDWFENEKTGDVYYNSEMHKGDEGTGAMTGEGWKHMGANGMFGDSDGVVLSQNKQYAEGGGHSTFPVYEQQIPQNAKVVGFGQEAMFKGENATNFMDGQGYEFSDKTSFSNVRTFYAANQIIPTGGSISVVNKTGTEVVTERTYVEKGMEQNSSIQLFQQTDKAGGYSSIFKTNYTYSSPSFFKSALNFVFGAIDAKNGDYSQESNGVTKVYSWSGVTDKSLLKYQNK